MMDDFIPTKPLIFCPFRNGACVEECAIRLCCPEGDDKVVDVCGIALIAQAHGKGKWGAMMREMPVGEPFAEWAADEMIELNGKGGCR